MFSIEEDSGRLGLDSVDAHCNDIKITTNTVDSLEFSVGPVYKNS